MAKSVREVETSEAAERAAVLVAERSNGESDPTLIRLSTGVVLRARRVPQMLLADIVGQFERPKPPLVHLADKGRDEENPSDPDYIARVQVHDALLARSLNDALVLLGTVIETVPESVPNPSDEQWLEPIRLLRVNVGESEHARYLAWVKYIAAPNVEDIKAILEAVGRATGVSEQDVADAVKRFRR